MPRIKREQLDNSFSSTHSNLALVPRTAKYVNQGRQEAVTPPELSLIRSVSTALVQSGRKRVKKDGEKVAEAISHSMEFVQKRFMFNIEQIEKRYSGQSSGLVFNLTNDEVEFDSEECSARNEQDLLNGVKMELHKHTLGDYGGTALLSTPAEDPDEKDKTRIGRWNKLNKLYDSYLKNSEKQKEKSSQLVIRNPLMRVPKPEPLNDITNSTPRPYDRRQIHYPSNLFPRLIRHDEASNAGSHMIDDPVVPLLTNPFRTPRVKRDVMNTSSLSSQQRVTRAQKRVLEIEENYDQREDAIYVEGSDWVERWVQQTVSESPQLLQPPPVFNLVKREQVQELMPPPPLPSAKKARRQSLKKPKRETL